MEIVRQFVMRIANGMWLQDITVDGRSFFGAFLSGEEPDGTAMPPDAEVRWVFTDSPSLALRIDPHLPLWWFMDTVDEFADEGSFPEAALELRCFGPARADGTAQNWLAGVHENDADGYRPERD